MIRSALSLVIAWFLAVSGASAIGGTGAVQFTLMDHHGRTVSEETYLGRPTLYFFGFTHCPDICPTALLDMSHVLAALGPDGDRINIVFVTLDPERDTGEQLARYLSVFDPRIVGLTGARDEVERFAGQLGAKYKRIPQASGYTIEHSIFSYLVASGGEPVGPMLIGHGAPRDLVVQRLRALITSQTSAAPSLHRGSR